MRLDTETEALIRRLARTAGRSKSWVIREAVAAYTTTAASKRRPPSEALAPFIGAGGTGRADLSERTGEREAWNLPRSLKMMPRTCAS